MCAFLGCPRQDCICKVGLLTITLWLYNACIMMATISDVHTLKMMRAIGSLKKLRRQQILQCLLLTAS